MNTIFNLTDLYKIHRQEYVNNGTFIDAASAHSFKVTYRIGKCRPVKKDFWGLLESWVHLVSSYDKDKYRAHLLNLK